MAHMKQSLASAWAKTWNQKNVPPASEEFDATSSGTEILEELPAAAAGFVRRHLSQLMLSLAARGVIALIWGVGQAIAEGN